MKKKSTVNKKRVRSVTWMPAWLLKLKGRMDSKYGEGVCSEFLSGLMKKQVFIESGEVITAENALFEDRKLAAVIISGFEEKKKRLQTIPEKAEGSTMEVIRMNRKNDSRRKSTEREIKEALEQLTAIQETVINTDTILDERINKIRNNSAEKVHAYIVGARSGALPDYSRQEPKPDNSAREIYHLRHEALGDQLQTVLERARKEEGAA